MDTDMSKFTDKKFQKNLYENLNFPDISKNLNRMICIIIPKLLKRNR